MDQVLIPSEALDELNAAYTFGDQIHRVGPIIQQSERSSKDSKKLRKQLKSLYNRDFDELVVTMLGSGVAAQERRARAVSDRGLAETVLANEFLLLEREVSAFLDDGEAATIRKALKATTFVARGNNAAAEIIQGKAWR